VKLDITFPSLACSVVSLDAVDISGEQHRDVRHNIFKKRLDPSGKVIEAPKADTINSPKVFFVHLYCNSWFRRNWEDLVAACCRYFL
jgi:hypothetical protein